MVAQSCAASPPVAVLVALLAPLGRFADAVVQAAAQAVAVLAVVPLAVALLATAAPAGAQAAPSFAEVVGHGFGERITVHADMVRYLEALDEASPRVTVVDQGASWEGRRLLLAVVTSPENHARLDAIQAANRRLADPRRVGGEEARAAIDAGHPAVVWLGGSIHGFELSGAEGVLALLERLTTSDDPEVLAVLDNVVVLLDPMINPDGRDAFAHFNHRRLGHAPRPERAHWSNDTTLWEALGFRTGHYFFDTNRDWFAMTQAETRARVPTLLAWRPQVMVDLHEMGPDTEFFFDPATEPFGPLYPEFSRRWLDEMGAAFSRAFDERGFEYTTGELFNYFYPGYTSSWGAYQGAVSMLFEQGSSRGLALERADGSVRTLGDALEQQLTGAWTTVATAAERRAELLSDWHAGLRRAVEAPGGEAVQGPVPARFLISEGRNPAIARSLAALLVDQGIEVSRLVDDTRIGSLEDRFGAPVAGEPGFPAGTWVVEVAQPHSHLVLSLLSPSVPVPAEFLTRARERVDRGENPRFYDATSWSLPLLFDVEVHASRAAVAPETRPWSGDGSPVAVELDREAYAYLVAGDDPATPALLWHLVRDGVRASVLPAATRVEGVVVPAGTAVVRNDVDGRARAALDHHARRRGVAVRSVSTGRPDEPGLPPLGTAEAVPVRPSRVALLAEGTVHPYSFGWTWYLLDRRHRLPVTVLRAASVGSTPLDEIDVLVIPDLVSAPGLAAELGEEGVGRLQRWVRDGGTLVVLGEAAQFAADGLGLVSLRTWYAAHGETAGSGDGTDDAAEDAVRFQRFAVPGAFFAVDLEADHWLRAGVPEGPFPALVGSSRLLVAPEGPPSPARRAVGVFVADGGDGEDDPGRARRLAGHAWEESVERLAGAVFLWDERVGRGRVVAFAEDPTFRAHWRGAERLLLNAVVLGPTAP